MSKFKQIYQEMTLSEKKVLLEHVKKAVVPENMRYSQQVTIQKIENDILAHEREITHRV